MAGVSRHVRSAFGHGRKRKLDVQVRRMFGEWKTRFGKNERRG